MYDIESEKLRQKTAFQQLSWDLRTRFGFAEILNEALMKRFQEYLNEVSYVDNQGRLSYWAVDSREPPGKRQQELRKKQVYLTLQHPDDILALNKGGIKKLREKRIIRITSEAKEQGALLTQEDLAILLCNSPRAIRYDIRNIRQEGIDVPTRGQIKDIGKGVSHKAKIVLDYLKGFSYTEIERRTHHSEESIDRYIKDFSRVVYLFEQGESILRIRQVTNLSESLIIEYRAIYEDYSKQDLPKMKEILQKIDLKKTLHKKQRGVGLD